ncbi:MAG: hypothetical protein HZB91_13090 [Elusimicrobia bacterium]|nr:hypothetical protein [Elusimicrobiota bacterium]
MMGLAGADAGPKAPLAALGAAPWAAPAALFLAAALLHCAPALLRGGPVVLSGAENDLASQFAPWREFGFNELRRGNLALWNPHSFGGAPFFGAFESALLYPPNWIHLFLPLPKALNAAIAFHLFLAGLLTWAWCRVRGLSQTASSLAGLLFMLSGPVLLRVHAGHLPILCGMAWAPGILLSLEGFSRRGKSGWLFFGAACVAMQVLAGNPQIVYYTAVAAALAAAGAAVAGRNPAPLAGAAVIYLGGAGLSAVQLLAGLGAAGESVRAGGLPFEFASTFSLPPENLATLFIPWFLGDIHRFPYFGRLYLWEGSLFISAAGLTLALAALFDKKDESWRLPAVMAGAMVVLALGARLPLYEVLYHILPGYDLFRGAAKFGFLAALFLSILAGAGLDRLRRAPPSRLPSLAALVLAVAMMAASNGLGRSADLKGQGRWGGWLAGIERTGETFSPPGALSRPKFAMHSGAFAAKELFNAGWVLVAISGLLYAAVSAPKAVYGLALLCILELGAFSRLSRSMMSTDLQYPERWRAALKADPGGHRVLHDWAVHPNAAMRLGLDDIMGYSQLSLKRYAEFIAASQGADPSRVEQYPPITRLPKAFSMLRLKYDCRDPLKPPKPVAGSLPRLNIIRRYAVIPDKTRRLAALMNPDFDPAAKVILETEPVPAPAPAVAASAKNTRPGKGGPAPQKAPSILRSSTDLLDFETELKEPALILITDNFSKGWRVSGLDSPQKTFTVLAADHTLMAVPLGAGRHVLRLEYRPVGFIAGIWLSLVSLALFCGLGVRAGLRALGAKGGTA